MVVLRVVITLALLCTAGHTDGDTREHGTGEAAGELSTVPARL